jgi:hypothetical protein
VKHDVNDTPRAGKTPAAVQFEEAAAPRQPGPTSLSAYVLALRDPETFAHCHGVKPRQVH